MVSCL